MKKFLIMTVACLFLFGATISTFAQSSSSSRNAKLESMQVRLDHREATLQTWKSDARSQIALAFTVGLLGLIVGVIQTSQNKWVRGFSAFIGLCVGGITLYTNLVFFADYHTLRRSVTQASRITENLGDIIRNFDTNQSAQNQTAVDAEFTTQCAKFDEIEEKMLGINPPSDKSQSKSTGMFPNGVVFAQIDSAAPAWTSKNLQSENSSTYFVGVEESKSLTDAKVASLENGAVKGVRWLKGDQPFPGQPDIPPQLLELVKHAADVTDTWFVYDRSKGVYRYYTGLRLPNDFRKLDLRSLVPMSVELPNDSAVRVADTGVILLLKHMGFAPISADLYTLSGDPKGSEIIEPYSSNRKLADKYVARFKSKLPSCNEGPAEIDGYSVSCFHVDSLKISRKATKAQHLGVVTAKGRHFDLFAIAFNYKRPMIGVEIRAAK